MPLSYAEALSALFSDHRNPSDAKAMQAYMKDVAPYFGIKTTLRRELQHHLLATWPAMDITEVTTSAAALFALPQRELHQAGIELLYRNKKLWTGTELPLFEDLLTTHSWWDSVDHLATKVIAPYFLRFPSRMKHTAEGWQESENLWLRRTAIIFQIPYKTRTDEALLFNSIRANSTHENFFIRKAIGWALREYAKTAPGPVLQFVEQTPLSSLSRREALRRMG